MIESITIKLKDKSIKLTLDEAIELRNELNMLLEKEPVERPYTPRWPWSPEWPYHYETNLYKVTITSSNIELKDV